MKTKNVGLIMFLCLIVMAIIGTLYKLPRIAGLGYGGLLLWIVEYFYWGYAVWRDFDKKEGLSFRESLLKKK